MKILTVGMPISEAQMKPGAGWVEVECDYCHGKMYCTEKNSKAGPNDTLVLACINCLGNITDIEDGSMDHVHGDFSGAKETDPWAKDFRWN